MGILREVTLHFIRQCFPSLFNTLHVSLGRGHVDSTDVVLSKSDPISIYGIPWQIIGGKLSGLSLQLPWMNRLGAKFSIKVKSVHIHITEVSFPNLQDLVFNAINDEMRRKKFRIVAEAERSQAPVGSSLRQIMSQVLERIELEVESFRAVIEFAAGFTVTFTVGKILAHRPQPTSPEHSRTLVVSIEDVSAIIKSSSGDVPLTVPDFSISVRIELDDDILKVNLDVLRKVDISVHSSLREFIHALHLRRAQWWSAHQWNRPRSCARTDALSWMRYAYRRMSAAHGLVHVRFDLERLRRTLRSFVEYKNLHVKRLNKSRLKTEEISRIAELEESFDSDLILLLRHAAQRDFAADEVSQFGTSEWLRWILFGHQMSSERDRLTADVRRSLEQSTGQGTIADSARTEVGRGQNDSGQYAFQCGFNGLSVHVTGGKHEIEISLTGLGFNAELDSRTGHYNVGLLFEYLLLSVDGDIIAREQPVAEDRVDGDHGTPQLTVTLSQSSHGTSASVHLHSMSVMLHPTIIESCSFVLQQWTSPLLPIVFDRQEYQTQGFKGDGESRCLNIFCASGVCSIGNMHVLLFDDRNIYDGKGPALMASLRQIAIRSPQFRTSFTPELDCSLSLQGVEFDIHSKPTNFPVSESGESSFASDRQQFFSFSAHLQLGWKPTVTVKLNNAVGFVHVPTAVRLMGKLWASRSCQVVEAVSSECDEIDVRSAPETVFDASDIQERFVQSGLQFVVSVLRINILWDSRALDHAFLLEIKQWETKLSSPTFLLVSMRIGNIRLSSSSARPFSLSIEPTFDFEHAVRLKRGSHPHIDGHFFEVLTGDVSSQLCADVVLAIAALVTDVVEKPSSSPRTAHQVPSSETDEHHSMTLLSLLATSLKLQWIDGQFHAEINCSDLQVAAEGNQVSGSAETATLTKVTAGSDKSSSAHEVILHVTDPSRTVNSAVRFLCEPAGFHIGLNNLTASAKRSFWEPLILSIVNVLEKLEEQHDRENVSTFEALQDDNRGTPIKIEGSGIILVLPLSKPGSPDIHADISQMVLLLQSGLQNVSFRRTAIMIGHADTNSRGLSRSQSGESTRILQTAGLDIEHKNFVRLQDAETSAHYSDTWEITAPNAVAIAISPNSLLTLRIGLAELLSQGSDKELTNAGQGRTNTCSDTPNAFVERTRILFRGSIKSLRLSLGIDKGGMNGEVFAALEAQEICLSSAEVRDRAGTDSCDVVVLSWLASCSSFHLTKYQPSLPEPWRIVIGCDVRRLALNFPSHGHQGVSVRFVSRQDRGRDTMTFDIRMSDVYVVYDPGLYEKLSRFISDCSRRINAVDRETIMETRENQNGEHQHHHYGEIAVESDSTRIPKASSSSSTSGDPIMASNHSSSAKVDVTLANFTLLCPLDEECDSVCCLRLHIRKTGMALVLSNLMHPMNGSAVRLEGISFRLSANRPDAKRFGRSITEEQSFGSGIYATQQLSNDTLYYSQVPNSMPFSAGLRHPGFATDKFVTKVEGLSVAMKRSQEDELVLSVGSVSVDTSIHTVLRLGEVISRYAAKATTGSQTFSFDSLTQSRLRLHVQSVALGLTVDHTSSVHWDDTTPSRGSMRVDLSVSLQYVTDLRFQTSQGTMKLSLDVSDNSSGHRDQLISPCLLRYRVKKQREYTIEAETRQLLRISFSPVTMRIVSDLIAALQNSDLLASTSDDPLAILETDSRLVIRIHGIAVRCLSDVPRIQVLRLLLGEIRFTATLTVESGSRTVDFSIREFLLEDTISWRLFRNDPTDSSSRRWERIIASIRKQDDESAPLPPGSLQDHDTSDVRLHTTRVRYDNAESSTRPALQCHTTWRDYFEDLKARIYSSGVDINLDLVALPIIQEWYNSVVRELPPEDSTQHRLFANGESQQVIQRVPWLSELRLEPLSITGGIRAAPRRLQESIFERLFTSILNVDSVTGLSLHLPTIHIQGKQKLTNLHQVLFSYSSTITRGLISQVIMQTGRFSRVVRLFLLSLFRQRPYNPLHVSAEKRDSVGNGNRTSVGLLVALDVDDMTRDEARDAPLVVERVAWAGGIMPRRGNMYPSVDVVDLT